jgi:uncharacterized membrane protein YeaQ/YmgE (transglycosylase-associated protein family)
MLNVLAWLVMGGVSGWFASLVMKTDTQEEAWSYVMVGIAGAVLAGWMVSPLIGAGTIHQADFSPPSVLVSLAGAAIVLAVVNLFRRDAVR